MYRTPSMESRNHQSRNSYDHHLRLPQDDPARPHVPLPGHGHRPGSRPADLQPGRPAGRHGDRPGERAPDLDPDGHPDAQPVRAAQLPRPGRRRPRHPGRPARRHRGRRAGDQRRPDHRREPAEVGRRRQAVRVPPHRERPGFRSAVLELLGRLARRRVGPRRDGDRPAAGDGGLAADGRRPTSSGRMR